MKKTGGRFEGAIRTKCLAVVLNAVAIGLSATVAAASQSPLEPTHAIPRLKLEEFRGRHASGAVLVVDVRDEFVFKTGHIPGAMSVPLAEIDRRASEIRSRAGGRPVVTYCSCPSEQTAASAAVTLSKLGISNVSVLVGGYPEWVATGGAIERGGGIVPGGRWPESTRGPCRNAGGATLRISASRKSAPFFAGFGAQERAGIPDGWSPGMHRVEMEISAAPPPLPPENAGTLPRTRR